MGTQRPWPARLRASLNERLVDVPDYVPYEPEPEVLPAAPPGATATAAKRRPSVWLSHGALILAQCIFGGGSVVGKLGVARFNPLVFALIREAAAGALLLLWALRCDGCVPLRRRRDAWLFLGCGVFIFTNQAAFIVGDKLAGAVLASAWQPTQPVFTLLISIALAWERCTLGKAAGILLSLGSATFMVIYGQDLGGAGAVPSLVGNALLLCNCLATALYVICVKLALARGYPPSTTAAWSYTCGATMMAGLASGASSDCAVVAFVCPVADGDVAVYSCGGHAASCAPWAVPRSALLPLTYWVLLNSCGAYWLITWGTQHAQASFVLAYCALQPLVAMALSSAIIAAGGPNTALSYPGLNALGAIGIVLGLAVILVEGKRQHEKDALAAARAELHALALARHSQAPPQQPAATPEGWRPCHDVPGALVRVSEAD